MCTFSDSLCFRDLKLQILFCTLLFTSQQSVFNFVINCMGCFFFFYFKISLKLVCALVHRTTGDVASPETVNPRGTLSVDNRSCQMDVGSSRIKLFPTNLNGLVIEG